MFTCSYCVVQKDICELAHKASTQYAPRLTQRNIQTLQSNSSMLEGGITPTCISESMAPFWQQCISKFPEFYMCQKDQAKGSKSPLGMLLAPKVHVYGIKAIRLALNTFHEDLNVHGTADAAKLRQLRAYTWTFSSEELTMWEQLLQAGAKKPGHLPQSLDSWREPALP